METGGGSGIQAKEGGTQGFIPTTRKLIFFENATEWGVDRDESTQPSPPT